jgi:asparagine synthase (glutamine-hydrolysing)
MYDRRDETLWLVRDRFGEKPLYYHSGAATLTFASTIRSLLKAPWISREVDDEALAEYLTLRYVVSPRTVLREVSKLPPGHILTHSGKATQTRCWWSPRFRKPAYANSTRGRRLAVDEFGRRLGQAASRCMVSDVPVGLLLSDGIDSNSIYAAIAGAGAQISTYTYKAASTSQPVDAALGGSAGGVPTSSRIDATYEDISHCVEPALGSMVEPIGDGSALATYLLIRAARSGATIFLCGHGGDEILGGYRLSQERFRIAAMRRLCRMPFGALDRMVAGYTNGAQSVQARRRALTRAAPWDAPAAARYLVQRPLPFEDLATLFAPVPVPGIYLGTIDRLYAQCAPDAVDLDRIQEVMLRTFLSENLLLLADSVAMASSAEMRLPFLDRDLADLIFELPPAMRVGGWPGLTNTKLILRWWAKEHVPRDVLMRRKRGFRFGSIRRLLKMPHSRVRDIVMESRILRSHLGGLEAWVDRPIDSYRRGAETTYWSLLTLAVWGDGAGVI